METKCHRIYKLLCKVHYLVMTQSFISIIIIYNQYAILHYEMDNITDRHIMRSRFNDLLCLFFDDFSCSMYIVSIYALMLDIQGEVRPINATTRNIVV